MAGQHDEQRERHCHQGRYERNLRESHFYPPYGAVVLGLALSPRAGWSVIRFYPRLRRFLSCHVPRRRDSRLCMPVRNVMHSMAGMLLSNDSRRPCNRMHEGSSGQTARYPSLRQHATLFLPASRPPVNAAGGYTLRDAQRWTGRGQPSSFQRRLESSSPPGGAREGYALPTQPSYSVIPAKAGIQSGRPSHARPLRQPTQPSYPVIPAKAGIQVAARPRASRSASRRDPQTPSFQRRLESRVRVSAHGGGWRRGHHPISS